MADGSSPGVIHWAARYDLLVKLVTLGREGSLRRRMLDFARVTVGEDVLDVGCGTGTLAIAAKRRVGDSGVVKGIDPSSEMIERARKKAKSAGTPVIFQKASAESIPYETGRFDVVLTTLMLHHLPREIRPQAVQEMRRVVKRGGRLLVVDFGKRTSQHRGLLSHLHRHGRVSTANLTWLVENAGLTIVEAGPVGVGTLMYVLANR